MSDFAKTKIGFALALLAVLFTTSPLTPEVQSWGFGIFGFKLLISYLYFFTSVLLAFSVYFYSFQFLSETPKRLPQLLGDYSYAGAVIAPLLYFALFLSKLISDLLSPAFASTHFIDIVQTVLALISGIAGLLSTARITKLFQRKESQLNARMDDAKAVNSLDRARKLFIDDHYDLSVVEAFRAIEIAGRKALAQRGHSQSSTSSVNLIDALQAANIIPKEKLRLLNTLRRLRNVAMHGAKPISRTDALLALEAAQRILISLMEDTSS